MHGRPAIHSSLLQDNIDVEMDAVNEVAVRERIGEDGLVVVGWYHSHPRFEARPSVIDIKNHAQHQVCAASSS